MKKLMIIPFTFILTCIMTLFAGVDAAATNCKYSAYFMYPNKTNYNYGERVYTRVEPKYGHHDVTYVKLYLDGQYIRKESQYKYEWAKSGSNSDQALRNPSPGWHTLKAVIYTKCGKSYYITKKFYVGNGGGGGGNICFDHDPMKELSWLKSKLNSLHGYKVCMYKKHGKYYFKFYPCNGHGKVYWYSCNGKICNYPSGAHKIKCWSNCDNGGGGGDDQGCKGDSYYYNFKTSYYAGDDVYVRVEPKYGASNIEFMTLYINGYKIRTENHYKYEWGGHGKNDHKLNNMKKGTYKLKCVIKTKCGDYKTIYKTFYVK